MLLSTPVDYILPYDTKGEMVMRAIQDRERRFEKTYTTDLYLILSGIKETEIFSTNELGHEWIDKAVKSLKKRDFIERVRDPKDRRRIELRTKPEEIYTHMIEKSPELFWELIEKGHLYFILRFSETSKTVICPKCHRYQHVEITISGNRASRYKVSEDIHIDIIHRHLTMNYRCECGFSRNEEADFYDPAAIEDLSRLQKAADSRRNLP